VSSLEHLLCEDTLHLSSNVREQLRFGEALDGQIESTKPPPLTDLVLRFLRLPTTWCGHQRVNRNYMLVHLVAQKEDHTEEPVSNPLHSAQSIRGQSHDDELHLIMQEELWDSPLDGKNQRKVHETKCRCILLT
jgi:hypothetical protein